MVKAKPHRGWLPAAQRFFQACRFMPNGCIEFKRTNRHGYGHFWVDGKTVSAHRFVWKLFGRELPDHSDHSGGLDHLCRNRACVNPAHLELVTQRENILRGEQPGSRSLRTGICGNGHMMDEANTYRWKGLRYCRACAREGYRRRKALRAAA